MIGALAVLIGAAILPNAADAQLLDRPTVLRGGRIVTMAGPPIEAGSLIIKGGRIEAVGSDVSAPFLSRTIDVSGKTITPGLINVWSSLGRLGTATGDDATASAWDAFDRYARDDFREVLRNGVTTLYVSPGGSAGVLGSGVVVRLVPPTADAGAGQPVTDSGSLHVNLGSGQRAVARLKTFKSIRKQFRDAVDHRKALEDYDEELKEYLEKLEERAKEGKKEEKEGDEKKENEKPDEEAGASSLARSRGRGANGNGNGGDGKNDKKKDEAEKKDELKKPKRPAHSRRNEKLLEAVDRKLQVRIEAHRSADILNALELAEEFSLDIVLEGATEAYLLADRLAKDEVPVVLGPVQRTGLHEANEFRRHCERNAAILTAAGVLWTIGSGSETPLDSRFVALDAQLAVRHEADGKGWLSKVTTEAAAQLGLAGKAGALRRGRLADLVVWSGDPSDPSSVVERVYVAGKLAYLADDGGARGGGR